MRMTDDEDLPVLDAVVRSGDPSIIRGLRMGRETLQAIESLRRAALEDAPSEPPDAARAAADRSPVYLDAETPRRVAAARSFTARCVASGTRLGDVDILLERPVDVLRRELRDMLQARERAPADAATPVPSS